MIATADSVSDRAVQLTGRDYLSVSAVKQYMKCPLSYRFRYIDKVPEASVSSALAFGRGIHSSAELWFTAKLEGTSPPTADALLSEFWEEWKCCEQDAEIRFGRNEDATTVSESAQRTLTAFVQSEAAQPDGHIVGIEEELRASLIAGVPETLGRLDLMTESADCFKVVDIKTSKSKWSDAQRLDAELQAVTYAQLAEPLAGGKPVCVEFIVITKTKTPSVGIETIETNPQSMHRGNAMFSAVWAAIECCNFYPAPSIMSCPSCPFRSQCTAWTG